MQEVLQTTPGLQGARRFATIRFSSLGMASRQNTSGQLERRNDTSKEDDGNEVGGAKV